MVDIVDKKTRSRMMAGITSRHTKPELIVRKALFRAGFRYRLHVAGLPGKPDVVLPGLRAVVLVHGCFWHQHTGCEYAYIPKSRPDFWIPKLASNVVRDRKNNAKLRRQGWNIFTVWECEITERRLDNLVRKLKALRPTPRNRPTLASKGDSTNLKNLKGQSL